MTVNHVVVDGSNLATEGRTLPSLQQLDDAVRSYIAEFGPKHVTVIVDASFPNRIDDAERATFEGALNAGELIAPPAGVIGRGDAFLLQIADRADAVVLSNDSFQEFHGQYGWLFDQGRLIGGKPVPHVGWVFMERSPVRGPMSRRSVSEAKKGAKKAPARAQKTPPPAKKAAKGPSKQQTKQQAKRAGTAAPTARASGRRSARASSKEVASGAAPAHHAELSVSADVDTRTRRRRGSTGSGGGDRVKPYNDALPFIEFVSAHPVGSTVTGRVERFASHGAYVLADGARAYLPLKHLGDPPPRSAREVLSSGESYTFVVHAFDTPRRGVDLTMQDVVAVTAGDLAAVASASDPVPDQLTEEERVAPAKKKAAKKKAPAKKRAAAKKAPAKRKAAAKKAPARKAAKKKAPAKKKAAAKKAPARKKAAAKKAPAKKKAAKKKAPAKKKAAAKKAPAKKKAAAKKAPAKKKAAKKKAPAKKKAAAKRKPAKKR